MKDAFSILETVKAIGELKKYFEEQLEQELGLIKVPCPLFVSVNSGLQDQLSGMEKAVFFTACHETFEIVHSLAKWKREALGKYNFPKYCGLYTDMKAIRTGEVIDDIHSLYVEQWDWEKIIDRNDRNIEYLKSTVRLVYCAIRKTLFYMKQKYSYLSLDLPDEVFFVTSQELENTYPDKTSKEREILVTKENKVVFIIGIGGVLKSGVVHDLRSPDYDDWQLNGDLLIYDEVLDKAIEISSMGIRVDEVSLLLQLEKAKCLDRLMFSYHQKIMSRELPYTIGGGIGQSRLLMLLLEKTHIAEVQASSWDEETYQKIKSKKIL